MTAQIVTKEDLRRYQDSLEEAVAMIVAKVNADISAISNRIAKLEAPEAKTMANSLSAAVEATEEQLVDVSAEILDRLKGVLIEEAQRIERVGRETGLSEEEAAAKAAGWLQRSMAFILPRVPDLASDIFAHRSSLAAVGAAEQEQPAAVSARPAAGDAPERTSLEPQGAGEDGPSGAPDPNDDSPQHSGASR